jgi:hypothetical protein
MNGRRCEEYVSRELSDGRQSWVRHTVCKALFLHGVEKLDRVAMVVRQDVNHLTSRDLDGRQNGASN